MAFYRKGDKIINLDQVLYIEIVQGFNILNFFFDGNKKYPVDFKNSEEREAAIKELVSK